MVVEEFTSFTISFVLNSPPCLLIMWLYHNFWPITSQNLHYYDNIVIVHCIGQMIYCNYISFLMQPFVFLEFVSVSFFICLVFYVNLCLILVMCYLKSMLYDYQCYFPVVQTHLLVPSPVPLFSWRSPIELVVFLVLLYSCHPGTGLYHSSVFNSLFPGSFAFCSVLVCSFVLLEHI